MRLLMSMYINQKLRVTFNGNSSEWFNVTNGVKQGGLYIWYASPVERVWNWMSHWGCILWLVKQRR